MKKIFVLLFLTCFALIGCTTMGKLSKVAGTAYNGAGDVLIEKGAENKAEEAAEKRAAAAKEARAEQSKQAAAEPAKPAIKPAAKKPLVKKQAALQETK